MCSQDEESRWKGIGMRNCCCNCCCRILLIKGHLPSQKWHGFTLPETNIAPKNGGWLEYYFPIGEAYFQVLC